MQHNSKMLKSFSNHPIKFSKSRFTTITRYFLLLGALLLSIVCVSAQQTNEFADNLPQKVIDLLENGMQLRAGTFSQVFLIVDASQEQMAEFARNKSNAITNFAKLKTNSVVIKKYSEIETVVETSIYDQRGGSKMPFIYGYNNEMIWKRVGDEVPWVVPTSSKGQEYDSTCMAIKNMVKRNAMVLPNLNDTFFMPYLGTGAKMKLASKPNKFKWDNKTNEMDLTATWNGKTIKLQYVTKAVDGGIPVTGYLETKEQDGKLIVTSINAYRGLVHNDFSLASRFLDFQVAAMSNNTNIAKAFNPSAEYKWDHWLEFVNEKWMTRHSAGTLVPLSRSILNKSGIWSKPWLRILIVLLLGGGSLIVLTRLNKNP